MNINLVNPLRPNEVICVESVTRQEGLSFWVNYQRLTGKHIEFLAAESFSGWWTAKEIDGWKISA